MIFLLGISFYVYYVHAGRYFKYISVKINFCSGEPVIHCMGPNGEVQVQYIKITGNRHKFSFAVKDEGEAV